MMKTLSSPFIGEDGGVNLWPDWPATYMQISVSDHVCVIEGAILPIKSRRGQSLCEIELPFFVLTGSYEYTFI